MSSETLDARIKGDIKETPEKKLLPVRPKTLRRRKKRKTLAITKRYARKRKLKNEKFKSFVIIIMIHVKNLFHWDKKG